ncbi:MAG: hypothetical protein RLZZ342_662 [Candidatus Parcubacteria bacterium]|jgi:hypothetical protein
MSDEKVLSENGPPAVPPLAASIQEQPKPIDAGPIYIGNSNTRGVVMQVHLHRFQQALSANHAGIAAVAVWLSLGGHHWLSLLGCVIGCAYSANLCRLWIDLIQDTVHNLDFWNMQIFQLVYTLGIKDYLPPKAEIERPVPKVQPDELYKPLKQCTVAWVTLGLVSLYQCSQTEEIKPWVLVIFQRLQDYLQQLC